MSYAHHVIYQTQISMSDSAAVVTFANLSH